MSKVKQQLVILAGGSGTRLWPVSRRRSPKQSVKLLDRRTLLQHTLRRIRGFAPPLIVVTARYEGSVRRQAPALPRRNILVEPVGRGTAAAIGLAAAVVARTDPRVVVTIINSDQAIRDTAAFRRGLRAAATTVAAHPEAVCLLGVKPTYPETGYGYIQVGKKIATLTGHTVHVVRRFKEKPDERTARAFIARGSYLWNPAIFSATAATWLTLLQTHLPPVARAVQRLARYAGTSAFAAQALRHYRRLPVGSIDECVLERTRQALVIPVEIGWADVGHWRSVYEVLRPAPGANVSTPRHVSVDGTGNLVYSTTTRLIATVGLRDMVIVDTVDALLVCRQADAQRVSEIVATLRRHQTLSRFI